MRLLPREKCFACNRKRKSDLADIELHAIAVEKVRYTSVCSVGEAPPSLASRGVLRPRPARVSGFSISFTFICLKSGYSSRRSLKQETCHRQSEVRRHHGAMKTGMEPVYGVWYVTRNYNGQGGTARGRTMCIAHPQRPLR